MSGWLKEREHAPLSMLTDWIKDGIHTLLPAKKLLDEGGAAAELAVLALKVSSEAVLLDQTLIEKMQTLVDQYRDARQRLLEQCDGQGQLAAIAKSYGDRADAYQHLVDSLGESPSEPPMTQEERDATSLLHFRMMKADLGLRRQVGTDSQGAAAHPNILTVCNPGHGQKKRSERDNRKNRVEELLYQLFKLHDLKADGLLEEGELVKLNEKVAMLHYGKDTDKTAVRTKYKELFREKFDPDGQPAPFSVFRNYMLEVLNDIDTDPRAQEMMLEQFCAEAESAREAFQFQSFQSASDAPFLPQRNLGAEPQRTLSRDSRQSNNSRDSQRGESYSFKDSGYPSFVPPTASIRGVVMEPTALASVAEDGGIESPDAKRKSGAATNLSEQQPPPRAGFRKNHIVSATSHSSSRSGSDASRGREVRMHGANSGSKRV
mmetsp:Transcript_10719/g.24435  ORF Transcript_10719/g.24435 Transcript_10719/m.24435 type:complete len:433 (+) Transcript_10719:139-1437(+)